MRNNTPQQLLAAEIEASSLPQVAAEIGIPASDLRGYMLGVALGVMHTARLGAWCAARDAAVLPQAALADRRQSSAPPDDEEDASVGDDADWAFVRGSGDAVDELSPRRLRARASRSGPATPTGSARAPGLQRAPRRAAVGRLVAPPRQSAERTFAPIREFANRRVEETSVRRVSAEIGPPMKPSALHVFLQGAEPYTRNASALLAWYERVKGTAGAEAEPAETAAWRDVPRDALVAFYAEEIVRRSLRRVSRDSGVSTAAVRGFVNRGAAAFTSPKVIRKLADYYLARGGKLTEDRAYVAPPPPITLHRTENYAA